MTPAERAVLARYPDAECWRDYTEIWIRGKFDKRESGDYVILEYDLRPLSYILPPRLGTGPTPAEAWANAAARLTQEET